MLCYQGTCGGVLVLEVASVANRDEEEVVWQELECRRLNVVAQHVQFHAIMINIIKLL